MKVSEYALSVLRGLHTEKQKAEERYNIALNSTIAALGLDPRLSHQFDIDKGELTPASEPTNEGA